MLTPVPEKLLSLSDHLSIAVRASVVLGVGYRAHQHKSLTPSGIAAAVATGIIHSIPPTSLYLVLLIIFFLTSSQATKYKQEIKDQKTKVPEGQRATGSSAQRTYVQVFCNSIFASVLIIVSRFTNDYELSTMAHAGIIAQYCGVIADTWSSEFGILSEEAPFLITTFEKVPPGTNGGVSKLGLIAGAGGSAIISAVAALYAEKAKIAQFLFFTLMGFIGTISDSVLGTFLQSTFVDTKDGKVLEPLGGEMVDQAVLWENKDNLKVVTGENILSNNQVNLIMSLQVVLLSMGLYVYIFGEL